MSIFNTPFNQFKKWFSKAQAARTDITGVVASTASGKLIYPSGLDSLPFSISGSGVPMFLTGTTNETILYFATIPSEYFNDNCIVEIDSMWHFLPTSGVLTRPVVMFNVENGGSSSGVRILNQSSATSEGYWRSKSYIQFQGSKQRQVSGQPFTAVGLGSVSGSPNYSTFDFENNNMDIYFTGQVSTASDKIGLLNWNVKVLKNEERTNVL